MHAILFAAAGTDDLAADIGGLWDTVVTFVAQRGLSLAGNLLAAGVIFIVGRWASKLLKRLVTRLLTKAQVDETLTKFLANIAYAMLLVFVAMAAVNRLGVDTTSFAAVVAAVGLAVGFALQNSLSNFASGVLLILYKPFEVGNFVDAGGSKGVVEEIHLFSTLMRTGDNVQIFVPNGQITSGTITNYSVKATRRIDLVVGCGYDDDLKAVKEFLVELLADDDRILEDPAPVVAVSELGESSVNFVVRPWVNAADNWAVRCDLTEKIKLGFDERGFNIPYPTRDVHIHNATA